MSVSVSIVILFTTQHIKMANKQVLLFSLISLLLAASGIADKVMFCYWGSWSSYRSSDGNFAVTDIDTSLCTHYLYAFAGIDATEGVITSLDPYNDLPDNWGKDQFDKFTALAADNPDIKAILAVGGWNLGSAIFSMVSSTAKSREAFADSVVDYLKQYGFQGIDIDWEYPTQRDGSPDDKDNFVLLLQTLNEKLKAEDLQLSVAVGADTEMIKAAYDIEGIAKYVDYIAVMTYDYHTSVNMKTGINSPLSATDSETGNDRRFNIEASIAAWLSGGAPAEKLLIAFPNYGRTFNLISTSTKPVIGAPISGPGLPGKYTQESGYLGYFEICTMITSAPDDWTKVYDNKTASLYAYNGRQWISYDDTITFAIKAQFVVDQKLGGAMVWPIETDDFRNLCDGGENPLQSTLKKVFGN